MTANNADLLNNLRNKMSNNQNQINNQSLCNSLECKDNKCLGNNKDGLFLNNHSNINKKKSQKRKRKKNAIVIIANNRK